MVLHVYIPNNINTARKWLEDEINYCKMNNFKYVIINENFGSLPFGDLLVNVDNDIKYVYYCYPENGNSDFKSLLTFVEHAVNLARNRWVFILTVSEWIVHYVNLFIYIGEFTTAERPEIMQQLNVKAYIRFDDAKVSKLSYESETRMFTMEPLPLVHRAPPQYDWNDVHDIAEWMTSLFIKLELAYDASRRD